MGIQFLEVVLEHSADAWPSRINRGRDAHPLKPVWELLDLLGVKVYNVEGNKLRAEGLTQSDMDALKQYGFGGLIRSYRPLYQG